MCMNIKEILQSWEVSNTHCPLLSNLCRISLTGFLTTKTQKGWSLAGASCGSSISVHGAMSVVVSEGCDSVCAQIDTFRWGRNIMQVSMHEKLMGLLGQCWLIALSNIFFWGCQDRSLSPGRNQIWTTEEQSGAPWILIPLQVKLDKFPSKNTKFWSIRTHPVTSPPPQKAGKAIKHLLNKTECEIRRAKVLHTSHVKTNLYIHTL